MANGTFNPLDPGAEPTDAEGSPNFDPTGGIDASQLKSGGQVQDLRDGGRVRSR